VKSRTLYRSAILLLLLTSAGAAIAAGSISNAREDLRQLRGKIEALQKRLTESEQSKSETSDALKESERAISDAGRNLRDLRQRSREASRQLAQLRGETASNEAKIRTEQAFLANMIYQQYVAGRSEPLKFLFNGRDPNRIARELHYFGYVTRARGTLIANLRVNLARLEDLTRQAAQKAAEIEAIADRQGAEKRRLEKEKQTRQVVYARISRDVQKQKHQMGSLRRDENRLTRLIEELSRVISRAGPHSHSIPRLKNERLPEPIPIGVPFQRLKGRLFLPVRGELGGRFGSPRYDGGPAWKGLFIATKAGEEVHAVASGRVVYADWLRGFGNLLIIDHGDSYMTLYGNNETLYKRVGDVVRAGEPIAAVGSSGGNSDSGLYFEMRYRGKPFDPLTWVTVK